MNSDEQGPARPVIVEEAQWGFGQIVGPVSDDGSVPVRFMNSATTTMCDCRTLTLRPDVRLRFVPGGTIRVAKAPYRRAISETSTQREAAALRDGLSVGGIGSGGYLAGPPHQWRGMTEIPRPKDVLAVENLLRLADTARLRAERLPEGTERSLYVLIDQRIRAAASGFSSTQFGRVFKLSVRQMQTLDGYVRALGAASLYPRSSNQRYSARRDTIGDPAAVLAAARESGIVVDPAPAPAVHRSTRVDPRRIEAILRACGGDGDTSYQSYRGFCDRLGCKAASYNDWRVARKSVSKSAPLNIRGDQGETWPAVARRTGRKRRENHYFDAQNARNQRQYWRKALVPCRV